MPAFCQWLEQSSVGANVRQSLWLFPVIEIAHLLGMIVLVGCIGAFDLRLLGWAMPRARVSEVAVRVLPWAWAGFAVQVITGAMLFSSEAVHVYRNPAFRLKMLLILLAGINALVFHLAVNRKVPAWDQTNEIPAAARLSGLISLLLWTGVVAAGRFIGFL